jgi:hypothetical protein
MTRKTQGKIRRLIPTIFTVLAFALLVAPAALLTVSG